MSRRRRGEPVPIIYDGLLFWYTERFDPEDDRCCKCREAIDADDVPLTLFRGHGRETWQARICGTCAPAIVSLMTRSARN